MHFALRPSSRRWRERGLDEQELVVDCFANASHACSAVAWLLERAAVGTGFRIAIQREVREKVIAGSPGQVCVVSGSPAGAVVRWLAFRPRFGRREVGRPCFCSCRPIA